MPVSEGDNQWERELEYHAREHPHSGLSQGTLSGPTTENHQEVPGTQREEIAFHQRMLRIGGKVLDKFGGLPRNGRFWS